MGRILIVDDEPDIVRMAARIIGESGHSVTTAKDGVEALALIDEAAPDLIILDSELRTENGLEVCQKIKSAEVSRHIPVLMMTAHSFSLTQAGASKSGADQLICKPFTREILLQNVSRLLHSS